MSPTKAQKTFALLLFVVVALVAIGANRVLQKSKVAPLSPVVIEQKEIIPEPKNKVIGQSVEGRPIVARSYGNGPTHLLFVGGIHGGYEWNSVLLAYEIIEYLDTHKEEVSKGLTVSIIPSLNPDAVYKVTNKTGRFVAEDVTTDKKVLATARFNAHKVDLNRNFDCIWKPKSTWRLETVSAGTSAFSEPETRALRDFVLATNPSAVVFWHSQANAVYASKCEGEILPKTIDLLNIYASASGYPAIKTFDAYEVTGAAEDWLASINVPSITVELKNHEESEIGKNLPAVQALIKHYNK